MRKGAFKVLPGETDRPRSFAGQVVDLTQHVKPATLDDMRTAIAEKPSAIARRIDENAIHNICLREQEIRIPAIGPWGPWKLWPSQVVGQARVISKDGSGLGFKPVGRLQKMRSTGATRFWWFALGAPIWHVNVLRAWLKLKLLGSETA